MKVSEFYSEFRNMLKGLKAEAKTITTEETYPVCLACGMEDTYRCNGDVSWCDDCNTVEGDWKWVDEDGNEL